MRKTLAVLALLAATPALAHIHWINWSQARDPVTKQLCCNEDDCKVLQKEQVRLRPDLGGAYEVYGDNIDKGMTIIPRERVQPSQDDNFYACTLAGVVRCFFEPPGGV